ncbi:MAG: PaaI family thioesterase [Syntrophomonadaceae bacterium]
MMVKYTDIQSMVEDGIIDDIETKPNCVLFMKQEFVEYVVGESATYAYPVLEVYANPRGGMQGGFISAAFDNTFGALVHMITKHLQIVTLNLNVSYHKPIYVNDKLIVTAFLKSNGKTIMHLIGEAYDTHQNLIATATSSFFLLAPKA